MSMQARIEAKLSERLLPSHLVVENESSNHNVPKGSETHFKVIVVSSAFEGQSRVERHRLVNGALAEELKAGVHALSIVSKTPTEWEADSEVPASPECLGGSKS